MDGSFTGTRRTQKAKEKFINTYEKKGVLTIAQACEVIKVNYDTFKKWRADNAFAKKVDDIKVRKMVEGAEYKEEVDVGEQEEMDSSPTDCETLEVRPVGFRDKTKEYIAYYRKLKEKRGDFDESQMAIIKQIAETESRLDYYKCLTKHPNYRATYSVKTANGSTEWKTNTVEKELRETRTSLRLLLTELGITYSSKGYKVKNEKSSFMARHSRNHGESRVSRPEA